MQLPTVKCTAGSSLFLGAQAHAFEGDSQSGSNTRTLQRVERNVLYVGENAGAKPLRMNGVNDEVENGIRPW